MTFWIAAFVMLNAQDRKLPEEPRESLRGRLGAAQIEQLDEIVAAMKARRKKLAARVFLGGIADYLRPGFHPDEIDDRPLAERALAAIGMA